MHADWGVLAKMSQPSKAATVRQVERSLKRLGRVITIRDTESAAAAAKKMHETDVGCLIVLDGQGKVAGVVSERDVIKKVVAQSANPAKVTVADIMNSSVISCRMDTSVAQANRMMTGHGVRHLPVIEDGVPLGMLSSRDILAYHLSRTKAIARRQSALLETIEKEHPEIARWRRDPTGRIIID